MSVTFTFARNLLLSALLAACATTAYAGPPSLGGAARSLSSGLSRVQQGARSMSSGHHHGGSGRVGGMSSNLQKLAPKLSGNGMSSRPQVQQLQKHLGSKVAPLVNNNKLAPKVNLPTNLSNKLQPSLTPKLSPVISKSQVLSKVNQKLTPIVNHPVKPTHCLPPCFPHPKHDHHHHHAGLPWYLAGVGVGLGAGYGNGGYGGGYVPTSPCEPVVIQVCPSAPVYVPGPQPLPVPAPNEEQTSEVSAEEATVVAETQNQTTPVTEQPNVDPTPETKELEKLTQLRVGALVDLRGRDFGEDLGGVTLKINEVELGCQVNEWKDSGVKATLPTIGVSSPTKAMLSIILRDGEVAQTIAVELLPASQAGPVVASSVSP